MIEEEPLNMTAGQMLAIVQYGWSTESERQVHAKVIRTLRKMADDAYKQNGARCEKCGHSD